MTHLYFIRHTYSDDAGTRPSCLTNDTFGFGVLAVVHIVRVAGLGDWPTVLEATLVDGGAARGANARQLGITSFVMG